MREVSDAFLLQLAEISAGLVGLFLVGVFFYVETGFRRFQQRDLIEPYFRAATLIVLVVFAIPIGVSLTLVALELVWSRVLFAVLSLMLVAVAVQTAIRVRPVSKVSTVLLVNEVAATIATVPLVVTPWVLGGIDPSREDLTWSILLSFVLGFLSLGALVLSTFDIARLEAVDRPDLTSKES